MENIILSEHFMLNEFTRSAVAERHHIDNSIDLDSESGQNVVMNLRHICETILEPLRQFTGQPIIISSGYRCAELNALLGGVHNSQHLTGEAVDIVLPTTASPRHYSLKECYIWLIDNTRFDQLIWETRHNSAGQADTHWIHVSLSHSDNRNRQHYFRKTV